MIPGALVADRFRIEHEAGAGGMGTVHRAIDLVTGEPVAIKVLREGVDAHRLARESSVLATLSHPSIVRHVAHGTTPQGRPFLAMEWLEGVTLSERLRAGTPPFHDALRIVRSAADALAVAHARGIVHRDVKPGNLFLVGGDARATKVVDFGIARRLGDQSLSLTTTGTVLGTPYYMSPEQARGHRAIDARADVWALGCVLYELLAGRPPFDHEQVVAVLAAILLEQPPPLAERCPEIPPALDALVARMLAKDPAERPEDGAALVRGIDALGPIRAGGSSAPSFSPRALTEREQRIVCLVLVERGIGARADAPTMRSDAAPAAGESLEGRVRAAAEAHQGRVEVLADGSLIVDVGDRGTPTDHAARAARCALALRAILPDAAIAIAAGRAVILGRLPVGEVIESGARLLASPAPSGSPRSIRIDAVVSGLLDGRFELGADGHGRLLCAERREPDTGRTLLGRPSPCVGRDREIAALEALYDECAREPIARVAIVTAPAGAGKSRVVSEVLRRLDARDPAPTVLSARGDPIASGSPFALLAQALRGAADIAGAEPVASRRAKLRARVARNMDGAAADRSAAMLGEIARVPFDDETDEVLRAARRDPQLRGDLARRALEDFLAAEAGVAPVVLVLDDLHLGDRPSIAFVDAALRHLADRPLFVIGVGRPELDEAFPDLFAERDPQITRLGRLTPRASRALIEGALGRGAPDALVSRLIERADGNAFFLEELVRAASGAKTEALPESVLAMVEARLASLDAESRRVLRAASVFGASAPRSGILALLGIASASPAIDDRLRDLAERELLTRRERTEGEPQHAFRSALVREAAYAMLTEDDRALGHRLAGEHLERSGESDPVLLAEHFDRGGDRARAARWWAAAADRALDGDDLATALARAERGLAADPPPDVRAALLRAKAAVHRWRGEYAIALEIAREAAALEAPSLEGSLEALEAGSVAPPSLETPTSRAAGTLGFFDAASIVISAAGQLARSADVDALVPAILAPAEPRAVGAQIVAICRAAAQLLARDRARADALVGRAEDRAASLTSEDPLAFAWIEVIRASRALRDGDVGAFVSGTEAAVAFYERAADARDACNQRVRLGNGWMSLGEPARAEHVLRKALSDAERIGLPLIEGYALQNLGHALALQRRWAEARDALGRAMESARRIGDPVLEAGARLYLCDVELETSASDAALAHAHAAIGLLEAVPTFRAVAVATLARALLARGEVASACAAAEESAALLARDPRGLEEGEARIRLAQIEALAAAGAPFAEAAARARGALVARAARISDASLREGFLRRVPEHARLLSLAEGALAEGTSPRGAREEATPPEGAPSEAAATGGARRPSDSAQRGLVGNPAGALGIRAMTRPARVRFQGRVLFLTEDPELLRRQLAGEDLPLDVALSAKLVDNISTDEITPGWVCFHYDETLGQYSMVGLRGGLFDKGTLASGGFSVIVSGESKGCGSSREQAPYSELAAGISLVIARSIEKIYGQNCQNIGLLTSTDFGLIERIRRGEEIAIDEFTRGLDPISADVVRAGGLFEYNKKRMAGELSPPPVATAPRPMTMVEKIIARHAVVDAKTGTLGVPAVQPGDALFVRTDVRFSHEYVTPMADALFASALGKDAAIAEPESVFTFRDHLTFLGDVMDEKKKAMGLLGHATGLATTQDAFAKRHGLKLYGEVPAGGSEAICHNAVIEDLGLPGQVITGTDSHTCMAGALGAFAFGVGSTDMANAWYTRDVRVKVPETVRFVLTGTLRPGVSAKDVMLHILSQPFFRTSRGIGKVLEFAGAGLATLPMDEQATLTNMAVEAGGFTGILEPSEIIVEYLHQMRGVPKDAIRARIVTSDRGASYLETFDIDLGAVPVMVATPGDPRNGVAMGQIGSGVKIDIAYGGSCTGGKKVDMDMYALVLKKALERGQRVAPGVRCYIQFGSQHIRRYAEQQGYVELFQKAGVELINPSCGACINAGPGASATKDQVTVSAINRNFPGRSGPGQVYLASPLTVAASAVAGRIVDPIAFLEG